MATGVRKVHVVAALHPLKLDTEEGWFDGGQTILEIIGRDNRDCPLVIISDGEVIECEHWHEVIPEQHLVINRMPADRGTLRSLAFIAVAIFAPQLGAFVGNAIGGAAFGSSYAGLTGLGKAFFGAAAGITGALAVNALIPPVLPSVEGSGGPDRLNAITGQSNQVAAFSPIPKVLGKPTYYPPIPMTGLPYTELVGEDQYIRMLVVLGYGPLDIGGVTVGAGQPLLTESSFPLAGDPIKIGGTAIDQFEDVEFEIGDPDDVTLFTSTIVEQAVNVTMPPAAAPTDEEQSIADNVQVIRTTEVDTDEVSLDLLFPALFTVSGQGNTRFAQIAFQVHRSPAGAGAWTLATSFNVGSIERKPLRRGVRFRLPSKGQYDIRLTRVSTYYEQENDHFADCTWTVMRSIKRNVRPFDVDDTVVMALRIRATDQLGGRIDRLSVEATSIVPVYNGSSWSNAPTRNNAWLYADVLSGNATKTPAAKSELDADTLLSWADWCTANGIAFDQVMDAEGAVFDRAREVAAAGFASWHVTDDALYSVVRDEVQTPKMVVTPRNSFGFSTEYAYHKLPHALRVQFDDPNVPGQRTERIVYDDGYNADGSGGLTAATRYEQIQTSGIRDPDHAWKFGRYHLAQLRLRPELYHYGQDIQHLVYQRGNTVELAHDVLLVGRKWGRIKSITTDGGGNVTGAEVDELLVMEPGGSYALKIQRQDGTIITEAIDTVSPSTQTVTFITPIAEHDYGAGLDSGIKAGDHFTFGDAGSETIRAKITTMEPQGDFQAQITAVPAAENIWDAWSGSIPAFDPVISEPIDVSLLPPVKPAIVSIRAESPPGAGGAPRLRIAVAFSMPPGIEGVSVEVSYRTRRTVTGVGEVLGEWAYGGSVPTDKGIIFIEEIEPGITYDIRLRSRRDRRISDWTTIEQFDLATAGWPGATDDIDNLVPLGYADFESAEAEDFDVVNTGGSTVSIGTDGGALGNRYLRIVCPNSAMGVTDRVHLQQKDDEQVIKVEAGQRYVVIAEFYAENADALSVQLQWALLGSGGSAVSSSAHIGDVVDNVGEWGQIAFELDATGDPQTSYILGVFYAHFAVPSAAPAFRVDKVALYQVTDHPEIAADV